MQPRRISLVALLANACGSPAVTHPETTTDTAPPPPTTEGAPDFDAICSWGCTEPPCDEPDLAIYTDAYLKYLAKTHGRSVAKLRTVVNPGPLTSNGLKQRMFFESGWLKVSWQVTLPESPNTNPTKAELVELFEAEDVKAPNFPPNGEMMPWSTAQAAIEDCESQYNVSFDTSPYYTWCDYYIGDASPVTQVTFGMTAYGVGGYSYSANAQLYLRVTGENIGTSCEIEDGGGYSTAQ